MKKRGIGIGSMYYGIGYGFSRQDISCVTIELCDDGSVMCRTGEVDYGQGSDTIICQIIAEELGINYNEIKLITADTFHTPNAGPTSASRVTYVTGNAALKAARQMRKNLEEVAQLLLDDKEIDFIDNEVRSRSKPENKFSFEKFVKKYVNHGKPMVETGWFDNTTNDVDPETGQGEAYALYAYASQIAVVEVDTETGKVDVLRVIAAHDVGKAINPSNVEGQIEGGVLMGVGYTLTEELKLKNGRAQNSSLGEYLLSTSTDTPDIESHIVEVPAPKGPYGAKGVGEPAQIPTAPAILNAIYNAVGVRITELPANLENVYRLIRDKYSAETGDQ